MHRPRLSPPSAVTLGAALAACLLASVGCYDEPSAPVPAGPRTGDAERGPAPADPGSSSSDVAPDSAPAAADGVQEQWQVITMEGQPVGFVHKRIEPVTADGRPLVQTRETHELRIQRGDDVSVTRISGESWDTPEGRLVRCRATMSGGLGEVSAEGTLADGKLDVTLESTGSRVRQQIEFPADAGGLFAVEQSLLRQPLQPGEERTLRVLMPPTLSLAEVVLRARGQEETDFPAAPRRLLRIESQMSVAGQTLEGVYWCDERGEVLKSSSPALNTVYYRAPREEAEAARDAPAFQLLTRTFIELPPLDGDPHAAARATYRASVTEGPLAGLFAAGSWQTVREADGGALEITVVRPEAAAPLSAPEAPPGDADKAPNSYVQSDDARVVQLAAEAAPGEADPLTLALALERHVKGRMRIAGFGQAFATAADTARSLEGDCTEHAMLLAAVCRARGLPARVATGLVYAPQEPPVFAYHMWTEVWIGDRWLPLDATRGQGGISPGYLKLADSNLAGDDLYIAFVPVMKALGRLKLEVAELE